MFREKQIITDIIEPIDAIQQQRVCAVTEDFVTRANTFFNTRYKTPAILFDLTGRAAGMFRVTTGHAEIRYNPFIFAKYFADNLAETIPHEVAHYIAFKMNLRRRILPHGKEWKKVMAVFGVEANRTCQYDFSGVPVRRQQRFPYRCSCTQYEFTTRRHNQVIKGKGFYTCRRCGDLIHHTPS